MLCFVDFTPNTGVKLKLESFKQNAHCSRSLFKRREAHKIRPFKDTLDALKARA